LHAPPEQIVNGIEREENIFKSIYLMTELEFFAFLSINEKYM
jgi:hypothetical protein